MSAVNAIGAPRKTATHSLPLSVLLHLFPGALFAGIYVIAAPLGLRLGPPPLLVLSALALLVLAPLELAHLLRVTAGRVRLAPTVTLPPAMPLGRTLLITVALVAATIVLYALSQPADRWVARQLMGALPPWFDFSDLSQYRRVGRGVLVLTVVLQFVADVLCLPLVEELYFRAYLLPRTPGPGVLAPVLNTLLFAVYHFWQPYNYISIFCFSLPMVLAVWRFRDPRLSFYTHLTLNLIGFVSFAVVVLRP